MRIKIGSSVSVRLYNSADKKFYGETFTAEVMEILGAEQKKYKILRPDYGPMTISRKEIKQVLS